MACGCSRHKWCNFDTAVADSGISITDGSTATPEIGTTGLLNELASDSAGASIQNLRVGVLNADTVIATYIQAGEIDAGKMTIGSNRWYCEQNAYYRMIV